MIIGPRLSTKSFTYDKNSQTFISEASDFGRAAFYGQLYDDACDEGFVLVSQKTEKAVPFYLSEVVRDVEGDITCWKFKGACPKFANLNVVILND